MDKEQYIRLLLEQIRDKRAKILVKEEIQAHIEDQMECYRREGYPEKEAEKKAIREMGDPIDTGVSLDRIHRPQMSKSMLFLIGILSIVGLTAQFAAGSVYCRSDFAQFAGEQILWSIVGFGLMLLICFLDYSVIGHYGTILSVCFLGVCVIGGLTSVRVGGTAAYIRIPILHSLNLQAFVYLALPLLGILLYKQRKKTRYHLLLPIGFCVITLLSVRQISTLSALNLFFGGVLMFTFASLKGWIAIKKPVFLTALWGAATGIPTVLLILITKTAFFPPYVKARLSAMFSGNALNYRMDHAAQVTKSIHLIGASDYTPSMGDAQNILSDYLLLHTVSCFGVLAAAAIIGLFVLLVYKMFRISVRQKNQLGMAMGLGCSLVFLIQFFEYALMNFGLFLPSSVFLPLFSYGKSVTLMGYLLLGILLSIYRYQNIAPENDRRSRHKAALLRMIEQL